MTTCESTTASPRCNRTIPSVRGLPAAAVISLADLEQLEHATAEADQARLKETTP